MEAHSTAGDQLVTEDVSGTDEETTLDADRASVDGTAAEESGAAGEGGEGLAEVKGGLERSVIRETIEGASDRIRSCYEAALQENPDLSGRVDVHFVIGADGGVIQSTIHEETVENDSMLECLLEVAAELRFPEPEGGGTVYVRYPWVFSLSPDETAGLPRDVIGERMSADGDRIRHCYEIELQTEPDLSGRLAVHFIIRPDGTVTDAHVVGDTLENELVTECILRAVQEKRFPEPEGGGEVRVTYLWVFSSAAPETVHAPIRQSEGIRSRWAHHLIGATMLVGRGGFQMEASGGLGNQVAAGPWLSATAEDRGFHGRLLGRVGLGWNAEAYIDMGMTASLEQPHGGALGVDGRLVTGDGWQPSLMVGGGLGIHRRDDENVLAPHMRATLSWSVGSSVRTQLHLGADAQAWTVQSDRLMVAPSVGATIEPVSRLHIQLEASRRLRCGCDSECEPSQAFGLSAGYALAPAVELVLAGAVERGREPIVMFCGTPPLPEPSVQWRSSFQAGIAWRLAAPGE